MIVLAFKSWFFFSAERQTNGQLVPKPVSQRIAQLFLLLFWWPSSGFKLWHSIRYKDTKIQLEAAPLPHLASRCALRIRLQC